MISTVPFLKASFRPGTLSGFPVTTALETGLCRTRAATGVLWPLSDAPPAFGPSGDWNVPHSMACRQDVYDKLELDRGQHMCLPELDTFLRMIFVVFMIFMSEPPPGHQSVGIWGNEGSEMARPRVLFRRARMST